MSDAVNATCDRLVEKLARLRRQDSGCTVFGADHHRYLHDPPLTTTALEAIETRIGTRVPEAFRAYLLRIGNGGPSPYGGAGPSYGVLAVTADSIDVHRVKQPCRLTPDMSEAEWSKLTEAWDKDGLTQAEEDAADDVIFGGILPICEKGCGSWEGLVMHGPHAGRIVIVGDMRAGYTLFPDFLAWYEDWLDNALHTTSVLPD
ncbi:SMI1/KNR4 family protein [Thalassococcus sp. S3]|uniref:SMI1/KNR4 family protein n=1 Tax=Thalassococcus sp. S3 TaxID=2017482 RepID=UPI0013EE7957|nr:SMI1/KNR4 family protein [Thalassococcus sp. S3]